MPNTADSIKNLEQQTLLQASFATLVLFLAFILLLELGLRDFFHWHSTSNTSFAEAPILEAELVEQRPTPQLHEASKSSAAAKEITVSKKISAPGAKQAPTDSLFSQNNVTTAAPAPVETHGPLVDYSPSPKLPEYLKNQNLKSTILIEFQISQAGQVLPRLLSSSGNEELDALALKTAASWRFRPAMRDGKAIDSKVRLRINFEVE